MYTTRYGNPGEKEKKSGGQKPKQSPRITLVISFSSTREQLHQEVEDDDDDDPKGQKQICALDVFSTEDVARESHQEYGRLFFLSQPPPHLARRCSVSLGLCFRGGIYQTLLHHIRQPSLDSVVVVGGGGGGCVLEALLVPAQQSPAPLPILDPARVAQRLPRKNRVPTKSGNRTVKNHRKRGIGCRIRSKDQGFEWVPEGQQDRLSTWGFEWCDTPRSAYPQLSSSFLPPPKHTRRGDRSDVG